MDQADLHHKLDFEVRECRSEYVDFSVSSQLSVEYWSPRKLKAQLLPGERRKSRAQPRGHNQYLVGESFGMGAQSCICKIADSDQNKKTIYFYFYVPR